MDLSWGFPDPGRANSCLCQGSLHSQCHRGWLGLLRLFPIKGALCREICCPPLRWPVGKDDWRTIITSSTQFLLAGVRSGIHPCFSSFSALIERSNDSSVTTWLFGVGEYAGKR